MADLVLKNVTKRFGDHTVVENFNLEIRSGEFVTLLGPSGCGKTTLLRMIAGLEKMDSGELYIGGKPMSGLPPQKRSIGMVFQSYALFPHMNVRNNIIFGLKIQKMPEHVIFEKLDWVLSLLGLKDLEQRLPREISGGQRQRVALARALVLDPDVLLLDEPLSNLDTALRDTAMVELKRIHQKVGKTVVYVSHNQAEAMLMSQRIAVINGGVLEQYAAPRDLYDHPASLFAAEFVGSPAANHYNGTLSVSEQGVFVELPFGKLPILHESHLNWSTLHGRCLISCFRPQDVELVDNPADAAFSVSVELVETLGDRNLVVGMTDSGDVLRFFVSRLCDYLIGNRIALTIDPRMVHLFDVETGKNIIDVWS